MELLIEPQLLSNMVLGLIEGKRRIDENQLRKVDEQTMQTTKNL